MSGTKDMGALANIPKDMPQQSMPQDGMQEASGRSPIITLSDFMNDILPDDMPLTYDTVSKAISDFVPNTVLQNSLMNELNERYPRSM